MTLTTVLRACAGATVLLIGVTACGSATGGSGQPATQVAAVPAAQQAAGDPMKIGNCADTLPATASLQPQHNEQWYRQNGAALKRIREAGHLVVGTSADVLLWGARNPKNGQLEGYDVALLKLIAAKIGVPITYRVINYSQRIPSLQKDQTDIVAHTMTINCTRWKDIIFSSEYYEAGQKVLVRFDPVTAKPLFSSVNQLKGKRICVANGSTNLDNIKQRLGADANLVTVDDLGECLVKFQQGQADAITGDDTVLAGFKQQDPYSAVVGDAFSKEPYGLGFRSGDKDFAEFVNVLLEGWRGDGTLAGLYATYMAKAVPQAPPIPAAVYGRTGNTGPT